MTNLLTQPSFYFHDYETFGIHPALDRPAQFAGIRTNLALEPIEDPHLLYCQPSNDYLPSPEAVLLTGITPQKARQFGVPEYQFAQTIQQSFSQPQTCIIGYNNIRFDDEVTRHLFYRNFIDPYAYSWQQGNSRWDLLDVTRACCALRPEGINWPINELGVTSFKLEHLTKANELQHQQAHDALSDVYATIAMAQLISNKQPKLFNYLYTLRQKTELLKLIDLINLTPLVHVSGMFSSQHGHTSIIVPLAWHPINKNALIVCDLSKDITPLFELTPTELRERLYTKKTALSENQLAVPLKLVHLNKCPVLAPLSVMQAEVATRLQLDRHYCYHNLKLIQNNREIVEKILLSFALPSSFEASNDVDNQLYEGFFSQSDRFLSEKIRQSAPMELLSQEFVFEDKRLNELLFRYKARHFPSLLTESEQNLWLTQLQQKFNPDYLASYFEHLEFLTQQYSYSAEKMTLIQKLYQYCEWLLN